MPAITTPTSSSMTNASVPQNTNYRAMAMVTTLFFMWGFLTCLNDILIPHLKSIFDLNYAEVMLVQFAFFSAYFIFSFPSGKIIDFFGYKRAMVAGLVTMGVGAFMFVPAAAVPSFPLFLAALITLAAGMTILQTSANPYVAVLGPPRTASSRLNFTQAFNSLGTTVAPAFGSRLILGAVAAPVAVEVLRAMSPEQRHTYQIAQASSVKGPYIGLALALLLLAVIIGFFKLPTIEAVEAHGTVHDSVWRYRHLVLGAVGIFVYVGAEVSIGSFLTNYFNRPDIGGLSLQDAADMLKYYWGGAMIGRFIGSALLQKISTGTLLGFNAIVACLLVAVSMLSFGHVAMWSILLVGLFNSIMFPSIFTLGVAGLGPLTGDGSALLIAAIVGGAIVPELQGVLADRIGIHHAFILPVICYLYIAYYGFRGSRPRNVVV
ncbi:MAG: sugar MFS transporter [Acidobacteria bacterium]|nr:sugar MFS transporter [Acidobacteriota bacterium]MBV9145155.1 sugar MFS transporter [Acidobacteriota bacterium]